MSQRKGMDSIKIVLKSTSLYVLYLYIIESHVIVSKHDCVKH
jgi:hypothetical protein